MRRLLVVVAALTFPIFLGCLPARGAEPAIEEFVDRLSTAMRSLRAHRDADEARRLERCRALTSKAIRSDTMARAAAAEFWDRMNPQQRQAFRLAFDAQLAVNCVRAAREYDGNPIGLAGVRPASGGEWLATTRIGLEQGGERMVTWRLRRFDSQMRAVDVIVDGRSTVISARGEYAALLRSNDNSIDAMIAALTR